jgi:CRISPR/Cas system-associated exonuclease Cas4 (RecB family)
MINIPEIITNLKSKRRKKIPSYSNRASEIGHPCVRYLVWNRTKWDQKHIYPTSLQYIFDEGVEQEKIIVKELLEADISLIEQQKSFRWEKYNISGHLDFKILDGNNAIPVEFKSLNPYTFDSIKSVDDLYKNKSWFFRKYPAQLSLYLLMDNKEFGLFLLKNKSNGQLKQIELNLDYDYAESLLQKVEKINDFVEKKEDPEPIDYDEKVCGSCEFKHVCCNDIKGKELKFFDDEEMEKKLELYHELKLQVKAYKQIEDELKEELLEVNKVVCGDYLIEGKWIDVKGGTCERKPSKYWKRTIKRIS